MRTIERLLIALMLISFSVRADEIDDTLGEHVVGSGETLWSITEKYLGDQSLWRENWQLNPQIENPNKLRIGQTLKVIKERRISARTAEVLTVANDVEKNLQRTDWRPATRGDDLAARDGIRTLRNSSAALQFNNNTALQLTEYSQIFLDQRETTLRNVDKGRIEVVKGSAELVFAPVDGSKTEIELVSGPAVTRPEPTADGSGRLKAVSRESGGASVMVYSGYGAVDAGGESVRVGAGLGTAVPESGPPSKPEKLLGSVRGLTPGDGTLWPVANQPLSWQPLKNAAHYIIEICEDARCTSLEQRGSDIEDPEWQPNMTRTGEFFWRVIGISASGLEGYPSRAVSFRLNTVVVDEMGPRVAVLPRGFYQRGDGGQLLIGPETSFQLNAQDDAIGVESIEFRWNDNDWQVWDEKPLIPTVDSLPVVLHVRATDRLGHVGPVARVSLIELR